MVSLVVVAEILLVLEHLGAVFTLKRIIVLVSLFVSFSVRDGVEDDPAEGASVRHPLLRRQMSQFVFVQLSLESEWSTTDVAVKLVRILTVLSSLMFHPASV